MNVQVTHNGDLIENTSLFYDREQSLCTGVGTLSLTLHSAVTRNFTLWDEIVLYENNNKKGTYYLSNVSKSIPQGHLKLECQDSTKRLTDYFIDEVTNHDYNTNTKYWIKKYLDEVGLSYNFKSSGTGTIILKDTSFGLENAFDVIVDLLQKSGWHMYANANGTIVIGKLFIDAENYTESFSYNNILSINRQRDDSFLRNRAVVIGRTDYTTKQLISVDISKHTPWNFDRDDKRAVVVASPGIGTTSAANDLAKRMLSTFTELKDEKTLQIPGEVDVEIGDLVFVNTDDYVGTSIVTTVMSSMGDDGFITTLILDEKCPRLVAPYTPVPNPGDSSTTNVYVGTTASGVWKKPLYDTDWSTFNEGFTEAKGIADLDISNGVFACVTTSGELHTRNLTQDYWSQYTFDYILDTETQQQVSFSNLEAVACIINPITNNIITGFNTNISGWRRSWVIETTPNNVFVRADKVYNTSQADQYDCTILDIDSNGLENVLSVQIPASGLVNVIASGAYGYDFGIETRGSANTFRYGYQDLSYQLDPDDNYYVSLLKAPDDGVEIEKFEYDVNEDGSYFVATLYLPSTLIQSDVLYEQRGKEKTTATYAYLYNGNYILIQKIIDHWDDNSPYWNNNYNAVTFETYAADRIYGDLHIHKISDTEYVVMEYWNPSSGTVQPKFRRWEVNLDTQSVSETQHPIPVGTYVSWDNVAYVFSETTAYAITIEWTNKGYIGTGNHQYRDWGLYVHSLNMTTGGSLSTSLLDSEVDDWSNIPFLLFKGYIMAYPFGDDDFVVTCTRAHFQNISPTSTYLWLAGEVATSTTHSVTPLKNITTEWGSLVLYLGLNTVEDGLPCITGSQIESERVINLHQDVWDLKGGGWFTYYIGTIKTRIYYDTATSSFSFILDSEDVDGLITYPSIENRFGDFYYDGGVLVGPEIVPIISRYEDTKTVYMHTSDRDTLYIKNPLTGVTERTIENVHPTYKFTHILPRLDDVDDTFYVLVGYQAYGGIWTSRDIEGFDTTGNLTKRFVDAYIVGAYTIKPRNIGSIISFDEKYGYYIEPIDIDYTRTGSGSSTILRQRGAEFTVIKEPDTEEYIEISNMFPTASYSKVIGFDRLQISQTNEVDSFSPTNISTGLKINDVRLFEIFDSSFSTASGYTVVASGVGHTYALLGVTQAGTTTGALYFTDTNLQDTEYKIITTTSGAVTHVETNNNTVLPYIFYTMYENGANRFFQRNSTETTFTEYNNNLTNSQITIIRIDDRL